MATLFDAPLVCPVLIGRSAHRDALAQAVEAAAGGAGGTVLLSGEAGIGKSRLVAEVRALAARHHAATFEGRTFETDRALPFAPLLDLLRGCLATLPEDAIERAAGTDASDLVRLLPEVAARLPVVSPAAVLEPEGEKRRLFHALAGFLLRLAPAGGGPLVLVVEDVHWADETSLEFLAFLARRVAQRPALLLITYRSDEVHAALRHFLTELDRERLAVELALSLLTVPEVERMVRAITGRDRPVHAAALHALSGLTEGNPFFIEEVLRSLAREGREGDDLLDRLAAGELPVPRTVQDAVQRRLAGLSAAARETLVLAAVAGRRWDFALLQELTGQEEADLFRQVKALVAAGLVVEESADRLAFRHALTREAVYADLLARERRLLHGRVAGALERRTPDAQGAVGDLAYHSYAAGDWGKAMRYGRQAGERARAMYAPRAAVEHLTRALEAAQQLSLTPPLDLYRTRARAHETLGNFEQARVDHGTALILAQTAGDRREEWQAFLDLGFLWASRDYEQAGAYWRRALALARTLDDVAMLAESLNRVGNWHVNRCETDEGVRYHDEALAILQELGDQRGVAETLDLLGMAGIQRGDLLRAAASYEQAIAAFDGLDLRLGAASSRTTLALSRGAYCMEAEVWPEVSLAEQLSGVEAAIGITREIGWRAGESFALKMLSFVLGPRGRYARALAAARDGLAIAEEIEHLQWTIASDLALGMLYLDLFALEAARPHLQRALATATETGSLIWIYHSVAEQAELHRAERDLVRAASVLDTVDASHPRSGAERRVLRARAELALAQHEPDRALRLVEQLIASAANVSPERIIPRLWLVRGEALAALERPTEAEAAFVAAMKEAERRELRPLLLRLHAALGRLYQRQRRSTEAERSFATARLTIDDLALEVPDEPAPALGGASLRDRFVRQATAGIPRPRPLTPLRAVKQQFGGLTSREREVAALIADGRLNREIAEALVVSERTVETHVGSILAKLGLDSRRQVALWAAGKGLAPRR